LIFEEIKEGEEIERVVIEESKTNKFDIVGKRKL
jgi:hypothetical protein